MNVEVKQSKIPGAGRGLFAKKDFAPGELVLQLDRPFVAELDLDRLQDTCAWCFRHRPSAQRAYHAPTAGDDGEVKACTGCGRVRYCGKACQTKAWKREHKYECKIIGVQGRPDLPHGVRAVIKLLGRLQKDPDGKDEQLLDIFKFTPTGSGAESTQLDDFRMNNPERLEEFDILAYGAWKYCGEPTLGGTETLSMTKGLLFNVMCNHFGLGTPLDDIGLGMGFDPVLCSANHSCDPNAVTLFNQPSQILRAIKPIKAGDEIFLKYVDVTNPFSVRQNELRTGYAFRCKCTTCSKGAKLVQDKFLKDPEQLSPEIAKVADSLIKRHEKRLFEFYVPANDETAQRRVAALQAEAFSVSGFTQDFNKSNEDASEEETLDALKLCLNSGLWSYTRQPVPHLIRQLITIYLGEGRMYQAWRLGVLRDVLINPNLFPEPFYPDRVVDCWTTAVVTNNLCRPDVPGHKDIYDQCLQAGFDLRIIYFGFLLNARDNIEKSYGRDSPLGQLIESVYQKTMGNTNISVAEIREMVKESWPKLEAVARNIDPLKL